MYITDTGNNRIRKVDTSGIISTFAGSGALYVLGDDGGPATSAGLNRPEGIAVDAAGNVYISDTFNHLVRKITPDGTIRNVAGNGNGASQGDGRPACTIPRAWPWIARGTCSSPTG
jgi:sugar lactone lactonase YvrE